MLGTARVEPLIRRIRNSMMGAEMRVENSKGECNFGQHEINFHYGDALATADDHVIYKNGAKEIAAQEEMSITFMAKFNEAEGNSCHIHCSMADEDGEQRRSPTDAQTFDRFLAGQLACLRELTLFFAPHVNSYKRFAPGSFAPTAVAWGNDNRTCSMRVVGHGKAKRVENRLPGADVNPYLALAAMIAAGLHGVDTELAARAAARGQRLRVRQAARARPTCTRRATCSPRATVAREAFGQEVVDHYLNRANGSSSTRSRPPSPTGSASGASSGCDGARRPGRSGSAPPSSAPAGGLGGRRGEHLAAHLLASGRRGRRRAGAAAAERRGDGRPGAAARPDRRADPRRGRRHRPRRLRRRRRDPETQNTRARARRASSSRSPARRSSATCRCSGICRGMEILNVALGGTLDQHLGDGGAHLHTPGRFSATTRSGWSRARWPRGPRAPSGSASARTTTRASAARRRARRERLGGARRRDRGDRAARPRAGRSASSGTPRRRSAAR